MTKLKIKKKIFLSLRDMMCNIFNTHTHTHTNIYTHENTYIPSHYARLIPTPSRLNPQNRCGLKSFDVASNFQPK